MSTVEEKYKYTTEQAAIYTKDWAAGPRKLIRCFELLVDAADNATFDYVDFPPALYKIVDEVIVNALDHTVVSAKSGKLVTEIGAILTPDGEISIFNTGPGIEIVEHKTISAAKGTKILVPTAIFGILHQGSNHVPPPDSITGGVNGLGSKVANFFSDEFTVTTCDGKNFYTQTWTNHGENVGEPVVLPLTSSDPRIWYRHQHVKVTFKPDYKNLGYSKYNPELHAILDKLIRARMWYAAAYAGFAVKHRVKFTYNRANVGIRSMYELATNVFRGATVFNHTIIPTITRDRPQYHYNWDVNIVVTDSSKYDRNVSGTVNGIVVSGGRHYNYLSKQITAGVSEYVAKMLSDKDNKVTPKNVEDNIFILLNTQVPLPSWGGQRKDELITDAKDFVGYKFAPKFITSVGAGLYDIITAKLAIGKMKEAKKKQKYEKYRPAQLAGSAKSAECSLIISEGDSAATQIATAISNVLKWDKYGVISTGGVIMNARDECVEIRTNTGVQKLPKTKLVKNEFFGGLVRALNLKIGYNYDPDLPDILTERKALSYGSIIICVDQDHDGKGNILGLLLTMFHTLWPGLIKSGFVKWFCTPIIRLYPKNKGKVLSFYSIRDYERFAGDGVAYEKPLYYKGIGSHEREENLEMFKSMHKHLYRFTLDERSDEVFTIYYGNDPNLRKVELSRPTRFLTDNEFENRERTMTIPCSEHLETDTNMYQKDNIERKLDHIIDGQNQAGRKVLDGVMKAFRDRKIIVVAQLAGYIAEHECYHHAVVGLGNVITGKGFLGTGGKQLPFIVPESNFGSRASGGPGDAADARYIKAMGNKKLTKILFPAADYPNLEFNYDEGVRCEPRYFVPIVPLAAAESSELPGHGWKMATWGRDIFHILRGVRHLINGGTKIPILGLNTYAGTKYPWKGTLKIIGGHHYSFGKYTVNGNTVTITELPLRVWTDPFIAELEKKKADGKTIKSVHNQSSDYEINIIVKFYDGVIGTLQGTEHYSGLVAFLKLYNKMNSHLNFYGTSGEVIELTTYEEIVYKWFPVRKEFYAKRLEREMILAEIELERAQNVLRYVTDDPVVSRGMTEMAMVAALEQVNYVKIWSAKVDNPNDIVTADLRKTLVGGPNASYDYLLKITDRDKSTEGVAKIGDVVADCQQRLDKIMAARAESPFPGASIWLDELDQFEKIVRQGIATNWKFERANKFTFE